jgi:predicted DNA-binding transcriptional regulator AlpA
MSDGEGFDGSKKFLPTRLVKARYNIVERTIDRWLASPELHFPRPLRIRRRRYWREADLVEWERSRTKFPDRGGQ